LATKATRTKAESFRELEEASIVIIIVIVIQFGMSQCKITDSWLRVGVMEKT
jgi:hypothetical protein